MFLETLLSTRERLVLSYVARDELTGAPLAPSSVMLELREVLGAGYLAAGELGKLFDAAPRPPLRRYDDRRAPGAPCRWRRASARPRSSASRCAPRCPPGVAMPDLPALRRALPPDAFAALSSVLGVHGPARRAAQGAATRDLRRWTGGWWCR